MRLRGATGPRASVASHHDCAHRLADAL